ncbi:MAG: CapA family protein, partial [bacterium]|nr:CapA family protein [bacterium]
GAEGINEYMVPKKPEHFIEDRGDVYRFSHTAIDNGADLVIGQGPHVVRGVELYKDKLIAYSLGNLIGYRAFATHSNKGFSAILQVSVLSNGDFFSGRIHPIVLTNLGIPQPDPREKAISFMEEISRINFPSNSITITSNGTIIRK